MAVIDTFSSSTYNPYRFIGSKSIPLTYRFNFFCNTAREETYGIRWFFTDWQRRDMMFIQLPEVRELMWLRNRGGSKTRDGALLAVFHAYQKHPIFDFDENGYPTVVGEEFNRVVWYAAGDAQLEQARQYFKECKYVQSAEIKKIVLWNGNIIKLRICTPKQAKSPRADLVIFDEEQDMDPKIYRQILGTMATSPDAKRLHMGTVFLDTQLHDNFNRLQPCNLVIERHIDECSWTTVEKAMEPYRGQPEFVILQELYCVWMRPGGLVFENVEVRALTDFERNILTETKYYGLDPNPKSGHAMVLTRYLGSYDHPYALYIEQEINSKTLEKFQPPGGTKTDSKLLAEWIWEHLDYFSYYEIEGQHGEELYKYLIEMAREDQKNPYAYKHKLFETHIYMMYWNEENKLRRVYRIRESKIIINEKCSETALFIKKCAWDPDKPIAKIEKTPDMHYTDAFIHSPSYGDEIVIQAY